MTATYDPIATTTLGSAASTITFSSIPNTFTDLRLVLVYGSSSAALLAQFRFNSDSGTNYSSTILYGNGSAAGSVRVTNASAFYDSYTYSATNQRGLIELDVFSYAGSTNKTLLLAGSSDYNGSGYTSRTVGLWRNTSAINSVTISEYFGANLGAGTTATLYGIKAE